MGTDKIQVGHDYVFTPQAGVSVEDGIVLSSRPVDVRVRVVAAVDREVVMVSPVVSVDGAFADLNEPFFVRGSDLVAEWGEPNAIGSGRAEAHRRALEEQQRATKTYEAIFGWKAVAALPWGFQGHVTRRGETHLGGVLTMERLAAVARSAYEQGQQDARAGRPNRCAHL
ncbi:hypothetical protein [Nocardioides sp. Leaf285]|uniref:hypothetical protein n=1 Tax=Nocardioides sp. Leaf285 TaxID=1736322 RepID=UPI0007036C4D|nr:hypothetical protein [Nocardioides sp. Leaf285]KQP63120.1 hypothetical protein ASF47_19110 [Nocardioides sp. Leaf285]